MVTCRQQQWKVGKAQWRVGRGDCAEGAGMCAEQHMRGVCTVGFDAGSGEKCMLYSLHSSCRQFSTRRQHSASMRAAEGHTGKAICRYRDLNTKLGGHPYATGCPCTAKHATERHTQRAYADASGSDVSPRSSDQVLLPTSAQQCRAEHGCYAVMGSR